MKISKLFSIFWNRISSENNSRTLNDTTSYKGKEESGSPLEQRIALVDYPYCDGVYEVKFTEKELQSDETFCKGVSSVISRKKKLISLNLFDSIIRNDIIFRACYLWSNHRE